VGAQSARLAAALLLTLRGTPTLYYGDEIGMQDVPIPPEMARDPEGKDSPELGRDPVRTPMQWDASPNAGFCPPGVEPWLPLADDHAENNVDAQRTDPRSMLNLVRRLLNLRRKTPALNTGSYRSLDAGSDDVFAYLRENGEQRVLVALNFGATPRELALPAVGTAAEVLCSTCLDREERVDLGRLELRPYEGIVALAER
jgi:alpha-glucosidase